MTKNMRRFFYMLAIYKCSTANQKRDIDYEIHTIILFPSIGSYHLHIGYKNKYLWNSARK